MQARNADGNVRNARNARNARAMSENALDMLALCEMGQVRAARRSEGASGPRRARRLLCLEARGADERASLAHCPEALGLATPWRGRMVATLALALSSSHGMINRVHGGPTHSRAPSEPARTTSFAPGLVLVLGVRDLSDGGDAVDGHIALLLALQPQQRISRLFVPLQELDRGPSRASELRSVSRVKLDVVHDGACRDEAKRHCISREHIEAL
mmetsp:Transcript_95731/g.143406  ORF Transcript_95731/g.143406 Transcript_95731/m.143406 type:complete len:214 (+) Transcript_95731:223-864(+)